MTRLPEVWPHGDCPPIDVGRMVLDRNPDNFFAEVEVRSYNKDGHMTDRRAGAQFYAPNSCAGPMADPRSAAGIGWSVEAPRSSATPTRATRRTTTSASRGRSTARS